METISPIIQAALTLFFAAAGVLKLIRPYAKFVKMPFQEWANDFKPEHVRLIGVLEVGGAVGLLMPLLWPPLRMLTPLAAAGGALIMAGALATHLRRAEYVNMAGNSVWLGLTLFVAYSQLAGLAA